MSQEMIPAIELEVRDGARVIAREVMDSQKIIIGRILTADFKVQDSRISRIHALLEWHGDKTLKLTDLASTHGTFVNGKRIIESVVTPQDEVKLANLDFKFRFVQLSRVVQSAPGTVQSAPGTVQSAPGTSQSAPGAAQSAPDSASSGPLSVRPSPAQDMGREPAALDLGGARVRRTEPTMIRTLKETARTRGVLESRGATEGLELTVYWQETVLAVEHIKPSLRKIRIGEEAGVDFLVPKGTLGASFDFIQLSPTGATLHFHPLMRGSVRQGSEMLTLEDLQKLGRSKVDIKGDDLAIIRIADLNFFAMFVPRSPEVAAAPLFDFDRRLMSVFVTLVLLVGVFLGYLHFFRPPIEGRVTEIPENLRRILVEEYTKTVENKVVNPVEPVKTEVKKAEVVAAKAKDAPANPDAVMKDTQTKAGGNEGEGARERGTEGRRGLPDAKNETGITNRPKVANAKKTQDARRKTTKPDAPVGGGGPSLLDSLKNSGLASQFSKLGTQGGGGGGAQGKDPLDEALSGAGGGGVRSGRGTEGSGLAGTGRGGGGQAVGIGGLGTQGFGGGAKGTGLGSIPGKGEFVVGTESAEISIRGSLTREEIERVIRAHANEVQFCYQRELSRNPGLVGKISFQWTIVAQGQVGVVRGRGNSTGSRSLETCLSDKLRSWIFPSPAEGSEAEIDWNWNFKPPAG